MFSQDRNKLRQFYVDAWHKRRQQQPMQPLEILVADVITDHPEYHALLEAAEPRLEQDFFEQVGDTNPFLHMGMHISLREQLGAGRPEGIRDLYQQLLHATGSAHDCEHQMMGCLQASLWQAQQAGTMPDEGEYLACLRTLLRK